MRKNFRNMHIDRLGKKETDALMHATGVTASPREEAKSPITETGDTHDFVLSSDYRDVAGIYNGLSTLIRHYRTAQEEALKGRSGHMENAGSLDIGSLTKLDCPGSFRGTLYNIVTEVKPYLGERYKNSLQYLQVVEDLLVPVIETYQRAAAKRIIKTELTTVLATFNDGLSPALVKKKQELDSKRSNPTILYMERLNYDRPRTYQVLLVMPDSESLRVKLQEAGCHGLESFSYEGFAFLCSLKSSSLRHLLKANGINYREADPSHVFGLSEFREFSRSDLKNITTYYKNLIS